MKHEEWWGNLGNGLRWVRWLRFARESWLGMQGEGLVGSFRQNWKRELSGDLGERGVGGKGRERMKRARGSCAGAIVVVVHESPSSRALHPLLVKRLIPNIRPAG